VKSAASIGDALVHRYEAARHPDARHGEVERVSDLLGAHPDHGARVLHPVP